MRRLSGRLAAATAGVLILAATAAAIDSRQPAPHFTATTLDGVRHTNETLKGRPVLLQFWTTWCRYCRGEQATVDKLTAEFSGKGLVVLAVNAGEPRKKVKQYLADSPRECPVVLMEDTNLAAMFQARSYPLYVLIDAQGRLAGEQKGAAGEAALRRLLEKVGLE